MTSAARVARGLTQERVWAIVLPEVTIDDVCNGSPVTGIPLYPADRNLFWADPFPVRDEAGDVWILVEEMHRWRGRGQIVALRIGDGRVVEQVTVVRSEHHFSFPQLHRMGDHWLGSVETCDPAAPLYSCTSPGEVWTPTHLRLPPRIIDPALAIPTDSDSPWYLTATDPRDEFAAYRQWTSTDGFIWNLQADLSFHDPVLARPAGTLDRDRGLRSAQDCSENYGIATTLLTWSPTEGSGQPLRRITGSDVHPDAAGSHTLAWSADGSIVVTDIWRRAPRAVSAAHRVTEQLHTRRCRR